jgi:hypothetical protein
MMFCEHEGCENEAVLSVGAGVVPRLSGPECALFICPEHFAEAIEHVSRAVLYGNGHEGHPLLDGYDHEQAPKLVRNRIEETARG